MDGLSPIELLKNRVDLQQIPFTERGSRLLVQRRESLLSIRLTERWVKIDPRVSGYRERPPIVDDFTFLDADGNPLTFELESYPGRQIFHTRVGDFILVFTDIETLLLTIPESGCGLAFRAHMNQAQTDRRGGVLRTTGDIRRNMAYTTNRKLVANEISAQSKDFLQVSLQFAPGERGGLLLNLTPRLGFNRYLPNIEQALQAARARWEDWFNSVPPVAESYRRQYYYAWYLMRAGLISTRYYTTREAMTPSKTFYIGVWQWDAFFHALAYRHVDRKLAHDQIRIVLDHQRPDGMLPDAVHDEGVITHLDFPIEADVTKPPLLAWTVWRLFEYDGDREFLEEVYEYVVRWNQWWFANNDTDADGLCEYQHPYSSGLDDSPLWDHGMPVTAPDLNTYLVLQMEALGKMARTIGLDDEAEQWETRSQEHLQRMLEHMYDQQAGVFWARHNGQVVPVLTPFNLFPLLTGQLPHEVAERLVSHLTNPEEFWAPYPVPSVAMTEESFSPLKMWRGPTWVNVNYLLIEGLMRSGYADLARELRTRTLNLLMGHNDIVEYYSPLTGEASPKAAGTFGWSAALFIDLALQASLELEDE